jgi:membrane fusion protein (multidrug efflux system)
MEELSTGPAENKPSILWRLVFLIIGIAVLVVLLFDIKLHLITGNIAKMKPPAAPTVTTTTVQPQDWREQIDTVGSLRAWRGTDLSTEVTGLVRNVRFRSGQVVGAGDALFELNADAERAQLRTLEAAADLAKITLARDKEQLSVSAVSQATIDADEADLKGKTALVEQQRALVEKKIIRAPFAGRTGITTVNPGLFLNTGDKVVTLQSIDSLYADFTVPQRELSRIAVGAGVVLTVDAWPQRTFEGKVTAISSAVDTGTRNVQVEATIPNAKHELLPGMFARVSLMVGAGQKYLTLPQSSVTFNPYGATVFVVDTAKDEKTGAAALKARQVFVTTGATRGDQVAVLTGIKAGEVVVTSGQLKLKTGAVLQVDNSVQPLNDPHPSPQEQ